MPHDDPELGSSVGSYVLLESIGKGAHGRVFKAQHARRGGFAAIKCMDVSIARRSGCDVSTEVSLLKKVRHRNVVSFFDHITQGDRVFLVMEFVPNSSLSHAISSFPGGHLPETISTLYVHDILSALAHLHALKIRQGDVKPENCLITSSGVLKLTDFGISTFADDENGDCIGTPNYMAPEQFHRGACFASDIWSTGCTIIHMRTGAAPWNGLPGVAVQLKQCTEPHPPLYDHASPAEKDFLMAAFDKDPQTRATATQLLAHRWLADESDNRTDRRRDTMWLNNHHRVLPMRRRVARSSPFDSPADGGGAYGEERPSASPGASPGLLSDRTDNRNRLIAHASSGQSTKSSVGGGTPESPWAAALRNGDRGATDFDDLRRVSGLQVDPRTLLDAVGHRKRLSRPSSPAVISAAKALLVAHTQQRSGRRGARSPSESPAAPRGNDSMQRHNTDDSSDGSNGSPPFSMKLRPRLRQNNSQQRALADMCMESGAAVERCVVVAQTLDEESCDFTSIADAIRCVPSGTAIFVEPGDYAEQLEFDQEKTLFVAGLGASGAVRVISTQSSGSRCALVLGGRVWLNNLCFELGSGSTANAGSAVSGGRPLGVGSVAVGSAGAREAIRVAGDGAVTLRQCEVVGNLRADSCVTAAGRGASIVLEGSRLSGARIGLLVEQEASARVHFCRLENNQTGFRVASGGCTVELRSSFLNKNTLAGGLIGDPVSQHSRPSSLAVATPVQPDTRVLLEECSISANRRGLECNGAGSLMVSASSFRDNATGLLVRGRCLGKVANCTFTANREASVELAGGLAAPTFSDNTFVSVNCDTPACVVRAASVAHTDTRGGRATKSTRSSTAAVSQQQLVHDINQCALNPVGFLDNVFRNTHTGFHVFIGPETNPSQLNAFVAAVEKQNQWAAVESASNSGSRTSKPSSTSAIHRGGGGGGGSRGRVHHGGPSAPQQQHNGLKSTDSSSILVPHVSRVRVTEVGAEAGARGPPRTPLAWLSKTARRIRTKSSAIKSARKERKRAAAAAANAKNSVAHSLSFSSSSGDEGPDSAADRKPKPTECVSPLAPAKSGSKRSISQSDDVQEEPNKAQPASGPGAAAGRKPLARSNRQKNLLKNAPENDGGNQGSPAKRRRANGQYRPGTVETVEWLSESNSSYASRRVSFE